NKNGDVFYTTEAEVTVNYVVMDAETGAIWRQGTITESKSESGLPDKTSLIKQVAFRTAERFVQEKIHPLLVGKVALVDVGKRRFVINLGSLNGVSVQTYFNVITKGDPIYDPDDPDRIIGYFEGERILARITSVEPNMCYAQPGFWRNVTDWSHPFGAWIWREEVDKKYFINKIEVGMEVRTVDEPEYH
ncbi:MAG: hypothetical protein ABIC40_09080, partial [bacterium]